VRLGQSTPKPACSELLCVLAVPLPTAPLNPRRCCKRMAFYMTRPSWRTQTPFLRAWETACGRVSAAAGQSACFPCLRRFATATGLSACCHDASALPPPDTSFVRAACMLLPFTPAASFTLWLTLLLLSLPAADTMDFGIPQNCAYFAPDQTCSEGERYPGLWEVPCERQGGHSTAQRTAWRSAQQGRWRCMCKPHNSGLSGLS
jgi:hypothetical protein